MPSGSGDQPPIERVPRELYGPLTVLRMHKDDGRALILYERTDGAGADPSDTAGETAGGPADDGADGGSA
jgi:hypothetical protein